MVYVSAVGLAYEHIRVYASIFMDMYKTVAVTC